MYKTAECKFHLIFLESCTHFLNLSLESLAQDASSDNISPAPYMCMTYIINMDIPLVSKVYVCTLI